MHLKPESLQRIGAFKFRGAYNTVASLDPAERARGVVTASSGNHAQALSLAAQLHGTSATILMPEDAPPNKAAATEGYGARIVRFDRYSADREALMAEWAERDGTDHRAPLRRRAHHGRPGHGDARADRGRRARSTSCSCRSAAAG